MRIETIKGEIVGCSELEQFTKKNGEWSAKCVLHIVGIDVDNDAVTHRGDNHPGHAEKAIVCAGDNTNWLGCIGTKVEVKYIHRVFEFINHGRKWFGNDLYAISIKGI